MTFQKAQFDRLTQKLAREHPVHTKVVNTYADGETVEYDMPQGAESEWKLDAEELRSWFGGRVIRDTPHNPYLVLRPRQPESGKADGVRYVVKLNDRPLQVGDWVTVSSAPTDPARVTAINESGAGRGRRISLYWPASGLTSGHWYESEIKERIEEPAPTEPAAFKEGDIVLVPAKYEIFGNHTDVAMIITEVKWRWEYRGYWSYVMLDRDGKLETPRSFGGEPVKDLVKLRQWPIRRGDFVQPNYLDEGREPWTWKVETVERNGEHPDEWFAYGFSKAGHEHSDGTHALNQVDVKVVKTNRRQRVVSEYDETWEVQS